MTVDQMKKTDRGEIVVLVDTDTSRENVSRAAASKGWSIQEVLPDGEGFRLELRK
jgi:KaiC/GvpD/RAD55 family RecA-like ATPase